MLSINMDILDNIAFEDILIPTCPQVAINLLKLKNNPNFTTSVFIKTVEMDPSLVLNLLKVARSNIYNKKSNTEFCKDIKTAVSSVLGVETALNIAIGLSLTSVFCNKKTKNIVNTSYWMHSIAVALIAKYIAHKYMDIDRNHAYLAGLLHDIGHLVLHSILQEDYLLSNDMSFTVNTDINIAFNKKELESYGDLHCKVGELLISEWNLPSYLKFICKFHHDSKYDETNKKLVKLIQLSENILSYLIIGDRQSIKNYKNIYLILSELDIKYMDLEESFETLEMIVKDYRESIISRS